MGFMQAGLDREAARPKGALGVQVGPGVLGAPVCVKQVSESILT